MLSEDDALSSSSPDASMAVVRCDCVTSTHACTRNEGERRQKRRRRRNNADINEWYFRPAAAGKIKSALVNDFA